MRAFLLLWAAAATILAVHFALRESPAPRTMGRDLGRDRDRTVALERRVRDLQAALATTLRPTAETTESGNDIATLTERYREQEGNARERGVLIREIYGKLASDASHHLTVMNLLGQASNDDEAFTIVELLVLNPFVKTIRNGDVTEQILDQARALMISGEPWQRDAAARILYGYKSPSRDDVLIGIERIGRESDPGIRDTLLEVLSEHAVGVAITESEAAPFVDALRDHLASGESWAANAISDWSADEADFERFRAGFRAANSTRVRQDFLNAFQARSRMGGQRADACRSFLIDVFEDRTMDETTRSMAFHFLKGYAPWDSATAERLRIATR